MLRFDCGCVVPADDWLFQTMQLVKTAWLLLETPKPPPGLAVLLPEIVQLMNNGAAASDTKTPPPIPPEVFPVKRQLEKVPPLEDDARYKPPPCDEAEIPATFPANRQSVTAQVVLFADHPPPSSSAVLLKKEHLLRVAEALRLYIPPPKLAALSVKVQLATVIAPEFKEMPPPHNL